MTADPVRLKLIGDTCFSIFLATSYLVFSSVSTTIFKTHGCRQFGDDPTFYLVDDQEINCDDPKHVLFKYYSYLMMLVYPFGITAMYAVLLTINRKKIKNENRAVDPSLRKIAFLFEMYEPRMWWFEVFECMRRLLLTGMLVFVDPGSSNQIIVAMLISIVSIVVYSHLLPFINDDDDQLAVVSNWAVFFTLFGALIVRLRVNETEGYDNNVFGLLLIAINSAGLTLVVFQTLYGPVASVLKYFHKKHKHNASLKGFKPSYVKDRKGYWRYVEMLIFSDTTEAEWLSVAATCGSRKEFEDWCVFTDVSAAHWRSGSGDGPIDQIRMTLHLDVPLEDVRLYLLNENNELLPGDAERFLFNATQAEGAASAAADNPASVALNNVGGVSLRNLTGGGAPNHGKLRGESSAFDGTWKSFFVAKAILPFPFKQRDFVLEGWNGPCETTGKSDHSLIVMRSHEDAEKYPLKKTKKMGRIRGAIGCHAYMLREESTKDEVTGLEKVVTVVTFVLAELELGGWLSTDLLGKMVYLEFAKKFVTDIVEEFADFDFEALKAQRSLPGRLLQSSRKKLFGLAAKDEVGEVTVPLTQTTSKPRPPMLGEDRITGLRLRQSNLGPSQHNLIGVEMATLKSTSEKVAAEADALFPPPPPSKEPRSASAAAKSLSSLPEQAEVRPEMAKTLSEAKSLLLKNIGVKRLPEVKPLTLSVEVPSAVFDPERLPMSFWNPSNLFETFDADKNGRIDVQELKVGLTVALNRAVTHAEASQKMAEYDSDKNHNLDKEEFVQMISDMKGLRGVFSSGGFLDMMLSSSQTIEANAQAIREAREFALKAAAANETKRRMVFTDRSMTRTKSAPCLMTLRRETAEVGGVVVSKKAMKKLKSKRPSFVGAIALSSEWSQIARAVARKKQNMVLVKVTDHPEYAAILRLQKLNVKEDILLDLIKKKGLDARALKKHDLMVEIEDATLSSNYSAASV